MHKHPEINTALVTGGTNGIGRAVVQRLLADGHEVVNLDRVRPAALQPGEHFVQVDVADEAGLRAALAEIGPGPIATELF